MKKYNQNNECIPNRNNPDPVPFVRVKIEHTTTSAINDQCNFPIVSNERSQTDHENQQSIQNGFNQADKIVDEMQRNSNGKRVCSCFFI